MQKKQSKIVINTNLWISYLIIKGFKRLDKVKSDIRVCRDLKDNFLLSLSMDSQADFLITGDNDFIGIKEYW